MLDVRDPQKAERRVSESMSRLLTGGCLLKAEIARLRLAGDAEYQITTLGGSDIVIGGRFGDTINAGDGNNIVLGDSAVISAAIESVNRFGSAPLVLIALGVIETSAPSDGGDDTITTGAKGVLALADELSQGLSGRPHDLEHEQPRDHPAVAVGELPEVVVGAHLAAVDGVLRPHPLLDEGAIRIQRPLAVAAHPVWCHRAGRTIALRPLHHRRHRHAKPRRHRAAALSTYNRCDHALTQIIGKGSLIGYWRPAQPAS